MPRQQVEQLQMEILSVLSQESGEEVGARRIAEFLSMRGFSVGERAIRYHLQELDERGFTSKKGNLGRVITAKGLREIEQGLVSRRLGFVITHIEEMTYQCDFNPTSQSGNVVVNTTFIPSRQLDDALDVVKEVSSMGLVVSPCVSIVDAGGDLGRMRVPGKMNAIHMVCSMTIDGLLLKAGIPVNTRYCGMLEIKGGTPQRFSDVIAYDGTSIDPVNIFLSRQMTSLKNIMGGGDGMALANIREIPATAIRSAQDIYETLIKIGFKPPVVPLRESRELLGVPVEAGRCGIAVYAGVNPAAAMQEAGIEAYTSSI